MEADANYRIEHRAGLTIVFGTLSSEDIPAVTAHGSVDDVLSPELAAALNATYVFGPSEAVDGLRVELLGHAPAGARQQTQKGA